MLGRQSALLCKWAEDGETPRPGRVLIAPPGTNLIVNERGRLAVRPGVKPRLGWPSVDMFFRSAAEHFGRYLIAVVLSGVLWDASDGIAAVRSHGGATFAQDYTSTEFPGMPTAAIDLGKADLMLTLDGICEALKILAERGIE